MRKIRKWGLAETPSAQFRLELGQSSYAYPTSPRQFYKSALRTVAASGNRSEDIADFPQKSRFLGVSRGCFSRLSPHPGQSGKSHLLSILIIYRYMHACQVSGKSYGNFLRSRLKSIKMSMIWTGNGRRLGVGPYPLLDCQNPLKKRRPPRERQCGVRQFAIFSTKGGRPRPPTVGERGPKVFHTYGFSYVLRRWTGFRRCLKNKTVSNYKKLVKPVLGQSRNSLFGFEALSRVDFVRCRKTVLWKDCFRWPEGPAETIQNERRNKKAVRNFQLRSNDAWLGQLTTRVEWNVEDCWYKIWENTGNVLRFTWKIL